MSEGEEKIELNEGSEKHMLMNDGWINSKLSGEIKKLLSFSMSLCLVSH
jgi:hypothetical protein